MSNQICPKCKRDQRDPAAHHITRIVGDEPKTGCTLDGEKPDVALQVFVLMLAKGAAKAAKVRGEMQALLDAEKSAHENVIINRNSYAADQVTKAKAQCEADKAAALAPLNEKVGLLERSNAELSGSLGGLKTDLQAAIDNLAAAEAIAATAEAAAKDAIKRYERLAQGCIAKDVVLGEQDAEIKALKAQIAALKAGAHVESDEMTLPTDEDDAGNPPTATAPVQAAAAPAAKPTAVLVDNDDGAEDEDDEPETEIDEEHVEASDDADEADEAKTVAPEPQANGDGAGLCLNCQKRHVARKTKWPLPLIGGRAIDVVLCMVDECRTAIYDQTFGANLVDLDKLLDKNDQPIKVEDDFDFVRLLVDVNQAATAATNN